MAATPKHLLAKLTLPTNNGGQQAENEYTEFHKMAGTQKLKRKYTQDK